MLASVHAQSKDGFLDSGIRSLQGEFGGNPGLEHLLRAPSVPVERGVPNLGSTGSWSWLSLEYPNLVELEKSLEISTSLVDSLVLVCACRGVEEGVRSVQLGVGRRGISGRNYPSFHLPAGTCEDRVLYLGMKSGKQIVSPLRLATEGELREHGLRRDLYFSMYFGIMLVMLLYNLVLYFTVEDRTYLLYVLFLVGVAGSQLFLEGYQWIIPGWESTSWLGLRSVHFVGIFSGATTIFFVNRFLDLARNARGYFITFNVVLVGYLLTFVVVCAGELNAGYSMINVMALGAVLVLPASVKVRRQGHMSALFLLIAFSLFFVAVIVFSAKEFGWLPHNLYTKFAMSFGSMVEVVLLSIALADRINQLKKESAKAREEQLRVSRLNEKITREQNEVLERRVRMRTEELEERNGSLRAALEELKLAQDQLVQSEKLASIGQLTAGIAHELNNPINFVSSSAQSLRRDFDDVTEVVHQLLALASDDAELHSKVKELQARMQQLDMEFTLKEIDELLTGIDDGSRRTSEIVRGLRIFSRMDGDAASEANLNELLESTLVILRSTLKDDVTLDVDLAPSVMPISCQPGKLNQVFMNLITNAAQATKAVADAESRNVQIRTRVVVQKGQEWVQVSIQDNGVGMTEEVKAQIFDPFFTTKEVGEGTGLGLSIVKGILDDHGATLDIESAPGRGSTFLISFPA
jgi:two-component system, NtrC family, sensor kinase